MATVQFKQYNTFSRQRSVVSEDSFKKGIYITDAPEEEAYAKMLVNFKLKNDGTVLSTRPAIQKNGVVTRADANEMKNILFTNVVECEITGSDKTVMKKATLVELADGKCTCFVASALTQELVTGQPCPEIPVLCTPVDANKHFSVIKDGYARQGEHKHDMLIDATAAYVNNAVQTKLSTGLYALYNDGVTANKLGKLKITFSDATLTDATWTLEEITAKEVLPAQAINYGYNMLKADPYAFSNVEITSGKPTLLGILPYDANTGELLLTAKLGTSIKFKLIYKYPAADKTNTNERYYTSWELYDLDNSTGANSVIQDYTTSPLVVPGDEVSLVYTPAIKSFGLVVKLYKTTELSPSTPITTTAQLKTAIDAVTTYIAPAQIITLASYYLTNDEANTKASSLKLVHYDLTNAQGMCAWQNRLVAWGVQGAEHLLFTSDISSPSYFPYPNGVEVFDNVIIKAVPYLDKLLVFTADALYMLTMALSGLTYTVSKVQDRLSIAHIDDTCIVPVLNMVHFKSGNYYYMIVPKLQSLTGALQLAPISRPIEQLLDNFTVNISGILNTVYNTAYDTFTILDTYTYVADNNVNNVYKLKCVHNTTDTGIVTVVLRYDTNIRAWTIWTYGTGVSNDRLYEITATGDIRYISCKNGTELVIIKEGNASAEDTFYTTFPNYQYIDTGFRKHSEQLKKRYREVQFSVNTLQDVPIAFYTAFQVDADERKTFYKHTVTYCTDQSDPDYGNIIVQRELDESGATPTLTNMDAWILDASQFPDLSVYKVRYKVSGKGYGGRVQMLCKAQHMYEILYIAWVFRTMNAR